jgi:hypothetical protein
VKRFRRIAATLLVAAGAAAQTPVPTRPAAPKPKITKAPVPKKTGGAPLDFSGEWVLDAQASQGVSPSMEDAVLRVRQTGNHIWVEPIGEKRRRLGADEIVVDGKRYEKHLGRQKGTVEAAWGKDGTSLWIEAVVVTDENPREASQRMIWRLRDDGKTWTRQTRTLQNDGTARDTFLVFRKQGKKPEPSKTPSVPR